MEWNPRTSRRFRIQCSNPSSKVLVALGHWTWLGGANNASCWRGLGRRCGWFKPTGGMQVKAVRVLCHGVWLGGTDGLSGGFCCCASKTRTTTTVFSQHKWEGLLTSSSLLILGPFFQESPHPQALSNGWTLSRAMKHSKKFPSLFVWREHYVIQYSNTCLKRGRILCLLFRSGREVASLILCFIIRSGRDLTCKILDLLFRNREWPYVYL